MMNEYTPETAIMRDGMLSLYRHLDVLEEDVGWFTTHGYRVFVFECDKWDSMELFHLSVEQTLGFPEYYGRNLDAFNDSLFEIDRDDANGLLLVFRQYHIFARRFPREAYTILDILAHAAQLYL